MLLFISLCVTSRNLVWILQSPLSHGKFTPPPPVLPCISVAVRQTQLRQENAFKQNGATFRVKTILFSLYEGDIFVKYEFFFSVCESAIAEKNTRNASIIRRVSQMPFSGCKCLVCVWLLLTWMGWFMQKLKFMVVTTSLMGSLVIFLNPHHHPGGR